MTENRPPLRIGHEERNAAIKALDEHLTAGRLDPDEYGDRMAAASVAHTREDLEVLFADLPQPHPFGRQPAYAPPAWEAPVTSQYPIPLRRRMPLPVLAAALVAVMPFVALMLFVLTKTWIFFLLIPAVGVLLSNRHNGRGSCYRSGRRRW